ncbi:hypothetical protein GCM10011352_33050 [Marinobacterium zhoushanense]|uniref:Uncharacterized protein n=1 Tax=Marinobacterium zhoushanense TaxID=1679163 RepID=A0ABQ1KQZ2_9GAMM|nr:hypothetical protein GCM10011352_33050 [Marinobacterium zhoushanense]
MVRLHWRDASSINSDRALQVGYGRALDYTIETALLLELRSAGGRHGESRDDAHLGGTDPQLTIRHR